jgi:hypothetical protein
MELRAQCEGCGAHGLGCACASPAFDEAAGWAGAAKLMLLCGPGGVDALPQKTLCTGGVLASFGTERCMVDDLCTFCCDADCAELARAVVEELGAACAPARPHSQLTFAETEDIIQRTDTTQISPKRSDASDRNALGEDAEKITDTDTGVGTDSITPSGTGNGTGAATALANGEAEQGEQEQVALPTQILVGPEAPRGAPPPPLAVSGGSAATIASSGGFNMEHSGGCVLLSF